MNQTSKRLGWGRLTVALTLLSTGAACASTTQGPQPLSHRIHDGYLAPVPSSQKQALFVAYADLYAARTERDHTEFALRDLDAEIEIAKLDLERAKLSMRSASKLTATAGQNRQKARVEQAGNAEKSADAEREEATTRLEYLKAERQHRQARFDHSRWQVIAAEAQFENAKAELAFKSGIEPEGFSVEDFREQAKSRASDAKTREAVVNERRQTALAARKAWEATSAKSSPSGRFTATVEGAVAPVRATTMAQPTTGKQGDGAVKKAPKKAPKKAEKPNAETTPAKDSPKPDAP